MIQFCGSEVQQQHLLQDALEFRSWGFSTIAMRGRIPAVKWKRFQSVRPRDDEINRMFAMPGITGLALVLGRASGAASWGICCRDFDKAESYFAWATRNRALANDAPTVRTSRGFHVYVRLLGDEVFHNWHDGELRGGHKHFAMLPPSMHPSGIRYEWVGHRPHNVRSFPLVSLDQAGFITTSVIASAVQSAPRQSPCGNAVKPNKENLNGLCANTHEIYRNCEQSDVTPRAVKEAVLRTLPHRTGERNSQILRLAQALLDIAPGVPPSYWARAVRSWWSQAQPVIGTKPWEATWREFVHAWERVELPASKTLPRAAFAAGVASRPDSPPLDQLMAGCYSLATAIGEPFAVAGRMVAGELDIPHRTAARLLERVVELGLLEVAVPGKPSARQRIATTYQIPRKSRTEEQL